MRFGTSRVTPHHGRVGATSRPPPRAGDGRDGWQNGHQRTLSVWRGRRLVRRIRRVPMGGLEKESHAALKKWKKIAPFETGRGMGKVTERKRAVHRRRRHPVGPMTGFVVNAQDNVHVVITHQNIYFYRSFVGISLEFPQCLIIANL